MTRRREFTRETKRLAFERSRGICECHLIPELRRPNGCGIILRPGHINYEHVFQDALGGGNEIENCAVLARNCWREKTDTLDLPLIAKNNRVADAARGIRSSSFRPVAGGRQDAIRRKFDGTVVDRNTGRFLSRVRGR